MSRTLPWRLLTRCFLSSAAISALFTHQLIDNYPADDSWQATKPNQHLSTKWLLKLDDILADDQLQLYTRAVLFLSSRGYTVAEFLQPGFGDVWRSLQPKNAVERDFMKTFTAYIAPIQQLQNCQDIFLKQRLNREHPWISNAGLFKYLKADEDYLGFKLAPKYLHQSYILYEIAQHRDATPPRTADTAETESTVPALLSASLAAA